MTNEEVIKELNTESEDSKHKQKMTNKETIDILNKLKSYFDSPLFENNQSIINALEVAVKTIENKEDLEKLNKNPFDRVNNNELYYLLDSDDIVTEIREENEAFDDKQYECSNYFNDKDFAKQVMLHQLLYRKLLKFKLEREKEDKKFGYCFFINLDNTKKPYIDETFIANRNCNGVYFNEHSTAELALKEVIKPFLKEHSDFIWNL